MSHIVPLTIISPNPAFGVFSLINAKRVQSNKILRPRDLKTTPLLNQTHSFMANSNFLVKSISTGPEEGKRKHWIHTLLYSSVVKGSNKPGLIVWVMPHLEPKQGSWKLQVQLQWVTSVPCSIHNSTTRSQTPVTSSGTSTSTTF